MPFFSNPQLFIMIRRDGNLTSLWQQHQEEFISNKNADTSFTYDVIVAGGGITGVTTALLLQEAGRKCLLIEASNLCFGTTGGTTSHLNTLLDTTYTTISKNFSHEHSELIAKVTGEAISLVKSNIERFNIDCGYEDADAFIFSQDEDETKELEEIFEENSRVGLQTSYQSSLEIPVKFERVMRVGGQGKFNAVKYTYALAKAFENAGGTILQQCRVNGVEENEPLEVNTTKGVFLARDIVYATHIPGGINLLHLRCAPWRSYAMAVKLSDDNYPAHLYYDMKDPYHYYRTQVIDGKKYLIAGGYDHKTGHNENTEQSFRELEAHIRKHFNVSEITHKWSSQYFEPADGIPYIGHLPGHPEHVYVATGFGGNGITYSQVSAMILKSLITGEETAYNTLFNPSRLKPIAGFKSFISHNADVVKQFIGKWFESEKLESLAELAPGDAKVVSFENQKIAIYKEPNGSLHAISPACTHMKCSVAWNKAESTWDCPCHGARYAVDGTVLNGPAVKDLEQIEVRNLVEK